MNIADAIITVIVGLLGLITPTEKFFKKIMERVKMGKTEDDRVKAAEHQVKEAARELKEAVEARDAADKAAAVLGKPEENKETDKSWIPGKKVKNTKTKEITRIRLNIDKPSIQLDNEILFAVGSPESRDWELV